MRFLCYVTRQQYPESSLSRREEENLNAPDYQVPRGDLLNRSPHSHLPTVSRDKPSSHLLSISLDEQPPVTICHRSASPQLSRNTFHCFTNVKSVSVNSYRERLELEGSRILASFGRPTAGCASYAPRLKNLEMKNSVQLIRTAPSRVSRHILMNFTT